MWEDPVVAETRRLRQEMMDEAGNDLDSLLEYLLVEQQQYKDRLVRLPSRRPVPVGVSSNSSTERR
jgi:hypothetical protein